MLSTTQLLTSAHNRYRERRCAGGKREPGTGVSAPVLPSICNPETVFWTGLGKCKQLPRPEERNTR
jgi:hypothetical protein